MQFKYVPLTSLLPSPRCYCCSLLQLQSLCCGFSGGSIGSFTFQADLVDSAQPGRRSDTCHQNWCHWQLSWSLVSVVRHHSTQLITAAAFSMTYKLLADPTVHSLPKTVVFETPLLWTSADDSSAFHVRNARINLFFAIRMRIRKSIIRYVHREEYRYGGHGVTWDSGGIRRILLYVV
jgi:hypothetical protein